MARIFVAPERLAGERLVLDGADHRHLARVLRLGPGADVVVFDGMSTEIDARVVRVGTHSIELVLGAMAILVLPLVTSAIQVGDGGRIGMAGVEVADRIGAHLVQASVPEAVRGVKHMGVRKREAVVSNDRLPPVVGAG